MSEEVKNTTSVEEQTPKQIKYVYDGNTYILEFSRKTVKAIEKLGYDANEIASKPNTMIPLLFRGAFMMHHNWLTQAQIDEIYESMTDRLNLVITLQKMYAKAGDYLFDTDDEDEPKKANWTTA